MTGRRRPPIAILPGVLFFLIPVASAVPAVATGTQDAVRVDRSLQRPLLFPSQLHPHRPGRRRRRGNTSGTKPEPLRKSPIDVIQARLNPIVPETVIAGRGRLHQTPPPRAKNPVDRAADDRGRSGTASDATRCSTSSTRSGSSSTSIRRTSPPPRSRRPRRAEKIPKPAQPAGGGYSLARQLGLGVRTIILDPGHGGADPGCLDRGRAQGEGPRPGHRPQAQGDPGSRVRPGRRPDPGDRHLRPPGNADRRRQPAESRPVHLHPRQRLPD